MKRTLSLLTGLAVIIVAIMLANRISATAKKPDLFSGFDKAKVTGITIGKYNSKETLKLTGKRWMATEQGEYPADTAKVAELLNLVADQKKEDPISKNPAKHGELRVDSANATQVTIEAGKNLWIVFVGSMAQGFNGNYLRFKGKNEVYVSKGSLDKVFSTAPNFYRDKALFRLNKDDVNEISVIFKPNKDSAAQEFSARFSVEKTAWKIEKPEAADGDNGKINEYLARFSSLEVDDWYDKDTTTALGFEDPFLRASLKKSDGSVIALLVGAEKNGSRYVKVEGDNNKYLLRSNRFDGLKPKMDELKSKQAPGDTTKAEKPAMGFPSTQP